MLSTGNARFQVSLFMYLRLTAFIEIEKTWTGLGIKDASAGLKLEGNMDFSLDLSIDGELRFVVKLVTVIRILGFSLGVRNSFIFSQLEILPNSFFPNSGVRQLQ